MAAALDRLVPEGTLGIAVSGGPDSLALLLLAAKARPGRIRAATVDHGLRQGSADEAAGVAQVCARLGIPHDILRIEVAAGASLQAQARQARYLALGEWAAQHGLAAVATAHHLDDQAETLLMRLMRGSGLAGLAGVRELRQLRPGVMLVRPLLGFRKADLIGLVAAVGVQAVDDPSNRDGRHDRTAVRRLLAANPALTPERLARSAEALAQAEEALQAFASLERDRAVSRDGEAFTYRPQAPREIRRRVALLLIQEVAAEAAVRGTDLERLLDRLEAGGSGALAGVLVRADGNAWRFEPAPPRT